MSLVDTILNDLECNATAGRVAACALNDQENSEFDSDDTDRLCDLIVVYQEVIDKLQDKKDEIEAPPAP